MSDEKKKLAEAFAAVPGGVWEWEPHGNGWALYSDRGAPIDPSEPLTGVQHGYNLLTVDKGGFDAAGQTLRTFIVAAHESLPVVLAELAAADAALEALGVPNHGEPIAERIAKAGHLQSALFRKLREHQEAHAETLGEIAKALDDAGAPDGMPLPERIRALRAADLAAVERVAAAYPPHFAGARHVLGLVREEMAKGPPALTDAELAAHRGLDAPTRADDEPDPETGWTRAEMRAACSPATRDFLAAMDALRDGGSEADGLEAFKAFLRAEHPR